MIGLILPEQCVDGVAPQPAIRFVGIHPGDDQKRKLVFEVDSQSDIGKAFLESLDNRRESSLAALPSTEED